MGIMSSRAGTVATRTAVAATIAVGGLLATAPTGQAATSHFNTDPYATGCSSTKTAIGSTAVVGGTATVYYSTGCQTKWVEYNGTAGAAVYKKTFDSASGKTTNLEADHGSWSYSMQSSAPSGTGTKFIAYVSAGGLNYSATCWTTCTWEGGESAGFQALAAKVDAFVAKWNGKYVRGDGYFGYQCGDVPIQYRHDIIGGTPWISATNDASSGGVKNWWFNAKNKGQYDKTKWVLVGADQPARKGDVAVWDANPDSRRFGHTALVIGDNGATLKVLTQNPGAAKIAPTFSKKYLLGYFRPIV